MSQKVWNDSRSGILGCMAGNLVLGEIQQQEGERITHEKGTIFSMSSKVIVGRVCSTDRYLQRGVYHFCNMSKSQDSAVAKYGKEIFYLFITVSASNIRYWLVPGRIVSQVLATLTPKPSTQTCFLRITEKSGTFMLGSKNVTRFYQSLPLRPHGSVARLTKTAATVAAAKVAVETVTKLKRINGRGAIPVAVNIGGQRYEGVLAPTKKNRKKVTVVA